MANINRILFLGAGAVGLATAGKLAANGDNTTHKITDNNITNTLTSTITNNITNNITPNINPSITVICRKRHADVINRSGLSIHGVWGNLTVKNVSAVSSLKELDALCISQGENSKPKFDLVVITSKSTDSEEICTEYKKYLADARAVINLQNGIGNEVFVRECLAKTKTKTKNNSVVLFGATITTNFQSEADGCVTVRSESKPIEIGAYPSLIDDSLSADVDTTADTDDNADANTNAENLCNEIVELFSKKGIQIIKSNDIRRSIWEKSLLNIAVNPLTAIIGVNVGSLLSPTLSPIIRGIIEESFLVLSAEKITLRWNSADEYLEYLYKYLIPSFFEVYTSMYQDFRLKRQTEIDYINGAVVKLGQKHNIPTPYNSTVSSLVKFYESQYLNQ